MYSFCRQFSWCSPDKYRQLDDWDKMVLITLLGGEQTGGDQKKPDKNKNKGQGIKKTKRKRK